MDVSNNSETTTSPVPTPPQSLGEWFGQNAGSLIVLTVLTVLVVMYTNPYGVILAILGLGLVIFVHELGHFAAAKWCDVHVETFSVGFGPAVPGCSFQKGETTYMLALIPLGGYVKMVGEGSEGEDGEDDPRSFKNKTVFQRMIIISAGVIMNLLLAAGCFVFVYMVNGVEEESAILGNVVAGSPAWQEGVRPGMLVREIDGHPVEWFMEVRAAIMHSRADHKLRFTVEELSKPGNPKTIEIEPLIDRDILPFPFVGIANAGQLKLATTPAFTGSAAASADFRKGDVFIGCTDPERPNEVTPLPESPWHPGSGRADYFAFDARMRKLAGQEVQIRVRRAGDTTGPGELVTVPPTYHRNLGLRMTMGEIVAVRRGSPAEQAGIRIAQPKANPPVVGDRIYRIIAKGTNLDGTPTELHIGPPTLGDAPPGVKQLPLDPIRTPWELAKWANQTPGPKSLQVTVLRLKDHTTKEETLEMNWDESFGMGGEMPDRAVPISGLGLAYRVLTTVDTVEPNSPAALAGVQPSDIIKEVRYEFTVDKSTTKRVVRLDKPDSWSGVWQELQLRPSTPEVILTVERAGNRQQLTLVTSPDTTWPMADRGFVFEADTRKQTASTVQEALLFGYRKTERTIILIYQNLLAMIVGRISPTSLAGPISIGRISYTIANRDLFAFILFLGLINVNLAVINFLPIPILDGGHMTFLIYELIRGKPAPEWLRGWLTVVGLVMILGLMLFVITLDVWRLIS